MYSYKALMSHVASMANGQIYKGGYQRVNSKLVCKIHVYACQLPFPGTLVANLGAGIVVNRAADALTVIATLAARHFAFASIREWVADEEKVVG